MNCVRCGLRAGYNRAVVDLASGVTLGGLCVDCEHEAFGESLRRGFWSQSEGCGLCPRDGHVALPAWESAVEEDGGDLYCSVAFEVTAATLLVCDEHLQFLRNDDGDSRERTGRVRT